MNATYLRLYIEIVKNDIFSLHVSMVMYSASCYATTLWTDEIFQAFKNNASYEAEY